MALARTGHLPLHLRSQDFYILDAPAISSCLATCFHRLRFVSWSTVRVLPLSRPAPAFQTFIGRSMENITLRSDFLGGVAGVLHTLDLSAVSFPSVCPALSTVTHLTLDTAYDAEQAATFGRLFVLFPALKFLSLSGLHFPFAHLLPRGQAPPSLVELRLVSRDPEYDLAPHYFDWRTTNLRDAFLTQARIPAQLNRLCAGAVNLALHRDCELQWSAYSDDRMRIIATDAAGRRCSIEFEDLVSNNLHLRNDIIEALRGLRAVRALEVPLPMAGALGPLVAVLPSLARLTLRVSDSQTVPRLAWPNVLSLARALDENDSASQPEVVVFLVEMETGLRACRMFRACWTTSPSSAPLTFPMSVLKDVT